MSNLIDEYEYEAVDKSAIEDEIQAQKAAQNKNADMDFNAKPDTTTNTNTALNPDMDNTDNKSNVKSLGFFATLGLSFLSISNNAIGGSPIEIDNIKLLDVKSMDELIVNEIIDSGSELDKKYFKDKTATPEFRYVMSMSFFYMIKGRLKNVGQWFKAHSKNKDNTNKSD